MQFAQGPFSSSRGPAGLRSRLAEGSKTHALGLAQPQRECISRRYWLCATGRHGVPDLHLHSEMVSGARIWGAFRVGHVGLTWVRFGGLSNPRPRESVAQRAAAGHAPAHPAKTNGHGGEEDVPRVRPGGPRNAHGGAGSTATGGATGAPKRSRSAGGGRTQVANARQDPKGGGSRFGPRGHEQGSPRCKGQDGQDSGRGKLGPGCSCGPG